MSHKKIWGLRVPTSWSSVPFRDLLASAEAPDEVSRMAAFLGVTAERIRSLPLRAVVEVNEALSFVGKLPSGEAPRELLGVPLRDGSSVTLGEFVDVLGSADPLMRVAMMYPRDVPYDPPVRAESAGCMAGLPVAQVWPALVHARAFVDQVLSSYPQLFEPREGGGSDDGWGWYRCVLACASGDPLRLDEAARMPVYAAFNFLTYKKTNS